MKNTIIMLILLALIGVPTHAQINQNLRQNVLKTLVEREINQTLNRMSYPGLDPLTFSTAQRRQLAAGEKVEMIEPQFPVLTAIFPFIKLRNASWINIYQVDNDCQVKKIRSEMTLGPEKAAFDLTLLSGYLPIIAILTLPLFGGFNQEKITKAKTTCFVAISNFLLFISIIVGLTISGLVTGGLLFGLLIVAAMIIVCLGKQTKTNKLIVLAGLISGTFAGVYAGRFSQLGFTAFSSQMMIIWMYAAFFLLAGLVSIVIMQLSKTSDNWKEVIFIIKDDYPDNN